MFRGNTRRILVVTGILALMIGSSVTPGYGFARGLQDPDPSLRFCFDTSEDESALLNRHGTASPPSLHGNQSFERNNKYWVKTDGDWAISTAGPSPGDGPKHLKWKPSTTDDHLRITIDATPGDDGLTADARINFKAFETFGGDIKLERIGSPSMTAGTSRPHRPSTSTLPGKALRSG